MNIPLGGYWSSCLSRIVDSTISQENIPIYLLGFILQNNDNAELFVNCLEAMVETCLPGDDLDVHNPYPTSLGIASNLNLSSSMSSLSVGSMHSPTEKDSADLPANNGARLRHSSANTTKTSGGSFKRKDSEKKLDDTIEWRFNDCHI